jgi:hypothetical protein
MPGVDNNGTLKGFMKAVSISILIAFFVSIFINLILMKENDIFSSWFVDVYKPSKGFILEKAPIRIIFFGESQGDANAENITKIIEALDKIEYHDYKFNPSTDINFHSSLKGARERGSEKGVNVKIDANPSEGILNNFIPAVDK